MIRNLAVKPLTLSNGEEVLLTVSLISTTFFVEIFSLFFGSEELISRSINFAAGPATLPTEVLERAKAELLDYQHTGMSIMEMSHRGDEFREVLTKAESDFRSLLAISEDYYVLFLQGGATAQFAAVPLNLVREHRNTDYLDTGSWSRKAIKEAGAFSDVHTVATSEADTYHHIPPEDEWDIRTETSYVHIFAQMKL